MRVFSKKLNEVMNADLSKANTQLCLTALVSEDIPAFQRVNITESVADHFRETADSWLDKYRKDHQQNDLVLKAYDAPTKPDKHELECIALNKHDGIAQQITSLQDLSGLELFAAAEEFVNSLRFYTVVVTPKGKGSAPISFFRFYTPKKELGRSKLFGIFMKKGQYDAFSEGLFLFDSRFDCFSLDDTLFICNKDGFQKIFRFYELLLKTAKETLKTIETHVPIENFGEFSQACEGHLQKVAKLKNIASKPYIDKLTIKDLKKVIAKYNLPIKTIGKGASEKLLFEPSDKWAILRLLDDDYLESVMTGESYEVNSKRTLQG
jgi:hypothetical protein